MRNIPLYLFVCLDVLFRTFQKFSPKRKAAILCFIAIIFCAAFTGPAFTAIMFITFVVVFVCTNQNLRKEISEEFRRRDRS